MRVGVEYAFAPARRRRSHPLLVVPGLALVVSLLVGFIPPALGQVPGGVLGGIRGFLFSPSGLPIVGARILIEGATVAQTDSEGMFFVDVPPGQVKLEVRASGYPNVETPSIRALDGQTTEILIVFKSGGELSFDIEEPGAALVEEKQTETQATVRVEGTIVEAVKGTPIEGARIFVRGTRVDARSRADGRFIIEVPEREQELTVIHPNFSTTTVQLVPGSAESLKVEMEQRAIEIAELVVTAPRIEGTAELVLKEQRESSAVANVLGADQISKAGDSDAAGALKRVTGVTVVGGRFVYVRGLGDRYSTTLLNSSSLPSPDPEKRVIPLDLFPAGIISSLLVQKTFSPDQPAEFGGGVVDIRTKDIPEGVRANVSASVAYLSGTTLETAETYEGSPTDFFGFGVAERARPEAFNELLGDRIIETFNQTLRPNGLTDNEIERLGEILDPRFGTEETTVIPGVGFSFELGAPFQLFGVDAGALVATNFGNSRFYRQGTLKTFAAEMMGETLAILDDRVVRQLEMDVKLSVFALLGVDFDDNNKLRLLGSVNRISEDRVLVSEGLDEEQDTTTRITRFQWVEQMLSFNQLRGEHTIPGLSNLLAEWRYAFSIATRDEPNRRDLVYLFDEGLNRLVYDRASLTSNQRFFSELFDLNHDVGLDLTLPIPLIDELITKLKVGGNVIVKSREVDARRFRYDLKRGADQNEVTFLPPDRLFAPDTIEPGLFELEEVTLEADNYEAEQTLFAGYGLVDFRPFNTLNILLGVRYETSIQRLETRDIRAGQMEDGTTLERLGTEDFLPGITATWEFIPDMQLRLAASRTVNRPNFRELSPSRFFDLSNGRVFEGNPDLQRALLTHFDLRWEWYPSPGESFSIAGFYKEFDRAIENRVEGGSDLVFIPQNVPTARNIGAEFEFRKNFGFITEFLEDLYLAANLALINSEVDLGDEQGIATSRRRPLQGQSPYAVNAQIGYDNIESRTALSVLFNIFGRRIESVGVLGIPDIYEEPVPRLDFVASQGLDRFQIGIKIKNILDPPVRFTLTEPGGEQRILNFQRFFLGTEYSLSLSVNLD